MIRSAARDVERPIFYAIAVIIAGYLPIYVLTGPSGRLFQPMADTMSFALLGSLLCALTLLPVLCAYFLRKHVKEPTRADLRAVQGALRRLLALVPAPPGGDGGVWWPVFAASLLLIPFIGAEFMPHLDEGALWVRATMPYTISFEEASKLGPQIRNILLSFPQVTTVANELGRPDDGHRSHRLFQRRVFRRPEAVRRSGLERIDSHQAELIDAIQQKLAGVSRHHLQLHAARRGRRGRGGDRA